MRIRFRQLAACWLVLAGGMIAAASQAPPDIVLPDPAPSNAPLVIESTRRSLAKYAEWLGPFPSGRVTIDKTPWLTARRDASLDRAIDAAIANQYAASLGVPAADTWFADGLAAYLSTRAGGEAIETRPYLTMRFFGGHVPHAIRISAAGPADPQPRLSEIRATDRARRFAIALHTLERFSGWPALQSALRAFMGRYQGGPPLEMLSAIMSEQRGVDTAWLFRQAMRMDARFDYAIVNLTTRRTPPSGWFTTVEVRRLGDATFDGTGMSRAAVTARSLPVVIRFADGSEISESIDGRDAEWQFRYSSASPATLASVDPSAILLLDADRTNNTRTVNAPKNSVGVRLAFNWLSWLQDAMLSCTAVI